MGDLLNQSLSLTNFTIFLLTAVLMLGIVLFFVMYAIYFERKVIGWMQLRIGPNRTGPLGLFQSAADVAKLLFKEDVIPRNAEKELFILAPVLVYVPSFAVLATIPYTNWGYFANLNVGVLYYAALSSISTIGVVLGGWASNNKYSLLGGMRSAAQMISYEIPLVLSMTGTIMVTGSMNLREIALQQAGGFWHWNFLPQIVGFVVFIIAGVSELNRTPFDLPEAESELVAGYHVEYSGFRFAFFMLAEYVYIFAISSLVTVLFLGGWQSPLPFLDFIPGIVWFLLKLASFVFFLFWIRATMPRIRVDHLMGFGWKVLLPLSIANIFITAIYIEVFLK